MKMSLILNNPTHVVKSLIWNTLIPPRLEMLDDNEDLDDNENEEDDDLSPMPTESEETNYMC